MVFFLHLHYLVAHRQSTLDFPLSTFVTTRQLILIICNYMTTNSQSRLLG